MPIDQALETMALSEILEKYPQTQAVLEQYGLLGYAKTETARYENLHASALVHSLDVNTVLQALTKAIQG